MMAKYAIASRDLSGYSFGPDYYSDVLRVYESQKRWILSHDSTCYGDVLVKTATVRRGFDVNFSIDWMRIQWKPDIQVRYVFKVEWLIFVLQLRWRTYESAKHGEIVKDWLKESEEVATSEP